MITTLTGSNGFGLKGELDSLVLAFVREFTDMAVERLDGEEASYERMAGAASSLPFLTARKMVVLREPGKQKAFSEKIDDFLAGVAETTDVIIIEPKLDKRLSYYKTLKKKTDFREFGELDANGLARWASDYAKTLGASLGAGDARFLVERLGANQQFVASEVEKLALYDSQITRRTIELLTEPTPQSTVFELLEAAFGGHAARAQELYAEQRALKVEPQQIIAMLAWQLHVLALVKTAGQRTPDEIAREAKISPFVAKKTAAIARTISLADIKRLVTGLADIDVRLKTESLDPDEALQTYLLQIAD